MKLMVEMIDAGPPGFFESALGDFNLIMKVGDADLCFEAQHKYDGRIFAKILTNEHVPTLSTNLFQDIRELYQGFIDAIEKKSPSSVFTLDDTGKITYKVDILVGTLRMDRFFQIQLEEQKLGEDAKVTNMIEKLTRKVFDQEKTIIEQGKEISNLEKMISEQAKIMKYLEERTKGDAPLIAFDPTSHYGKDYILVNSKRTAVLKRSFSDKPIAAKDPLPKLRVTSFSIRVEHQADRSAIKVGIAPASLKLDKSSFVNWKECIYFILTGSFQVNGKSVKDEKFPAGKTGTVIKVTTDLIRNKVSFYFEDLLVETFDIDAQFVQAGDYYPFVQLSEEGDRVSFISYEVIE